MLLTIVDLFVFIPQHNGSHQVKRYIFCCCWKPTKFSRAFNPQPCYYTDRRKQTHVKKKVKWSRYRPGVAQRLGRGIALLFHDRGTRRAWVVSSTPRPHFTPGKDPVPILQEDGWAPCPVWTGGKSRPHRDSIPNRPARSSVAIPTELPGPQTKYVLHYYSEIKYILRMSQLSFYFIVSNVGN